MLLTGTHYTKYSSIYIPDYKSLKTNHPDNTAHGGITILIKSSIAFQSLPNFYQPYLQSCSININLNNVPITIAVLYSPPKHKITNQILTDSFNMIKRNFIVWDDYNAKNMLWGCRTNNPCGLVLQNFTSTKYFKFLAPDPTYWPTSTHKNSVILDIFVAKIPNNFNCKT